MPLRRRLTLVTIVVAVVLVCVAGPSDAVPASRSLDLCTLLPRATLEHLVKRPLGSPHDLSTEPIAAGCHFPARAVGGTDIGLYASTNVPQGIKKSYGGNFFATLDSFARVYGTATAVTGAGTNAYSTFTPGHLAQGALLVLDGPRRAVLVVLVGEYVTAENTVTAGRALAKLVLHRMA